MKILTDKGLVNFWSNVKSYISKAIFPANQINLAGGNKTVQQFYDDVTENVGKNSDEIKKAKSRLDTQDEINKQQEQKNTQFDKGFSDVTSKATRMEESISALTETDGRLQSQLDSQQNQITSNDSDISNLQDRSTQLEKSIKDITVTGGASTANAVSYDNEQSGLNAVTAQGAIDELQETKFDKDYISQELGDAKDKVVSQFALPLREIESDEFAEVKVDADEKILEAITTDGEKRIYLHTKVQSANINDAANIASEESEEWLDLKTDKEGHIIEGISRDGKKFINLPLENPTIKELEENIRQSYLEIVFDEETGELNAILGDKSIITDVSTDNDGNIYITEEISSGYGPTDPDTLATFASIDINNETILFNK